MELLYIILVLLVVTRLSGEIAVRFGQPALIGELLAGVALGLVASQYSETLPVIAARTHARARPRWSLNVAR